MGILDFLFRNEKEKEKEISGEEFQDIRPISSGGLVCNLCKQEIMQHEFRRKFQKKAYHKKCFKNMMKVARQEAFK